MDLDAVQSALRERKFSAWLFYDHHHRDPIAYRVLGLRNDVMVSRRWFYLIPTEGEPQKLVHRIEAGHLDALPGTKRSYSSWQELQRNLQEMVTPYRNLAMQYSPQNAIPYVGLVDAGTVELVRSFGVNVLSSADLVSQFEAVLNDAQIASHYAARDAIDRVTAAAFKVIAQRVRNGGTHEFEMMQWILEAFRRENLNAVYLALHAKEVKDLFACVRDIPIHGISVTMPYKEEIIKHLEEVAITTARALEEVSTHWDAVYRAMRRAE